MGEPIDLNSGLLALATFALQPSIALHKTFQSFRFQPKQIRDLKEEIETLSGILGSIIEDAETRQDTKRRHIILRPIQPKYELSKQRPRNHPRHDHWRNQAMLRYFPSVTPSSYDQGANARNPVVAEYSAVSKWRGQDP